MIDFAYLTQYRPCLFMSDSANLSMAWRGELFKFWKMSKSKKNQLVVSVWKLFHPKLVVNGFWATQWSFWDMSVVSL